MKLNATLAKMVIETCNADCDFATLTERSIKQLAYFATIFEFEVDPEDSRDLVDQFLEHLKQLAGKAEENA